MTNKVLRIFCFIPVINILVAFYCGIVGFIQQKILKNFLGCGIFAATIFAFAIPRIITTIVCSYLNLPFLSDIVTYTTLYISVTLGTFLWVNILKPGDKKV